MLTPGSLVGKNIDQFRLEEFIGQGAMGILYKAFDTILHRIVALKLIPKDAESPTPEMIVARKRLIQEAQAAGRLSHPNIVTIHSYGETDEFQYICMEYILGKTLGEIIDTDRILAIEDATAIIEQILLALDVANKENIIHRDIKPNNIMVMGDGRIKVMDFGIAKLPSLSMTATGTILGTPYYMSPEQISGQKIDIRSDLFSAGTVLYQMITGVRPFEGETTVAVAYKISQVEPVPPKVLNVHIPLEIENICKKALTKDPALRYQTPGEMLRDLRGARDKMGATSSVIADATIVANSDNVAPKVHEHKGEEEDVTAAGLLGDKTAEQREAKDVPSQEPVEEKPHPAPQAAKPKAPEQGRVPGGRTSRTWLIASGLIVVIAIGTFAVMRVVKKGTQQNAAAPVTATGTTPVTAPGAVRADGKGKPAEQPVSALSGVIAGTQARPADQKVPAAQLKSLILQAKDQVRSNPANARRLFEQALAQNPNNFEANYQLARLLTSQKDFQQAIPLYRKAQQLDGRIPEVPFYLGYVYMSLGNYDQALQSYKACRVISPPFQEDVLIFHDGIRRAKAERGLSRSFQEEVSTNMGICYVKRNNAERARHHFREALELNPENSIARDYLEALGS